MGFIAAAFTFVLSGGNVGLSLAAFNAVDTSISAYQSGASLGRSIAAGGVGLAAGYAGYQLGAAYGKWAGLGEFGSTLFGSIGANVAGSSATAAVLGGDVGDAALGGLAGGTIAGTFGYFDLGFIGLPLAGGVSAEIQGGDFWEGAGEGFLAFSATAGIQALQAGRPKGNPAPVIVKKQVESASAGSASSQPVTPSQSQAQMESALSVKPEPSVTAVAPRNSSKGLFTPFEHQTLIWQAKIGVGLTIVTHGADLIAGSGGVLATGGPYAAPAAGVLVLIGLGEIALGVYVIKKAGPAPNPGSQDRRR